MTGKLIGMLAGLAILVGPVLAAEAPRGAAVGETVEYRIMHSKYDEIGSHKVTFSQDGDDLVVDVAINIEVKFLFITAHSLVAQRREVWRDGRFVGYKSHTDENSDLFEVTARAEGDKLVIEGPAGRVEADAGVFPTHPWNPAIAGATQLMDTKTGGLLKASVAPEGSETIEVAGHAVETNKYAVTGDIDRELWFAADGGLLQFRFPKDGETLTFKRVTPLE